MADRYSSPSRYEGPAGDSPNHPLPAFHGQFQKPEVPRYSVPELSMISDDLNASKLSRQGNRVAGGKSEAPTPPPSNGDQLGGIRSSPSYGPFPDVISPSNGILRTPGPATASSKEPRLNHQNRGHDAISVGIHRPPQWLPSGRRCSDGGASIASSTSSSSSSGSSKRILPPAMGLPRRNSSGQMTPQSREAPNQRHGHLASTPPRPTAAPPPASTVEGLPNGTIPGSRSAPVVETRSSLSSIPSNRPSPLSSHNRTHSFPARNGDASATTGLRSSESPPWNLSNGMAPKHDGNVTNGVAHPQQKSRPWPALLPACETREVRSSDGTTLPFDADSGVPDHRDTPKGQVSPRETAGHREVSDRLAPASAAPMTKETRSDSGSRLDDVHPVVLEMLRMQEANIRLLQEQVMMLMRRQDNEVASQCCCARRGCASRNGSDARDDARRDVGVNVGTSFHLGAKEHRADSLGNDAVLINEMPHRLSSSDASRSNEPLPSTPSTSSSRGPPSRPPSPASVTPSRASSSRSGSEKGRKTDHEVSSSPAAAGATVKSAPAPHSVAEQPRTET